MNIKGKVLLVATLIILAILSYTLSFGKSHPDITLPNPEYGVSIDKGVAYKKNSFSKDSLRLDIYRSPGKPAGKRPVIVYLHGGAWSQGSKNLINNNFREFVLADLVKNNYIVISADYTLLTDKIHLDKPLQDVKDILTWVKDNEDQYQFDTENVGLWGGSSGAHLALLTAYQNQRLAVEPRFVIDFFAPTDLRKFFRTDANSFYLQIFKWRNLDAYNLRTQKIKELTGFNIFSQQKAAQDQCITYSPVQYINKNTVPTLIFQGDDDHVVDASQSYLLDEKLTENKIDHQLYIIEGAKHSFTNITLDEAKDIAKKTLDFVKKHTGK